MSLHLKTHDAFFPTTAAVAETFCPKFHHLELDGFALELGSFAQEFVKKPKAFLPWRISKTV